METETVDVEELRKACERIQELAEEGLRQTTGRVQDLFAIIQTIANNIEPAVSHS